MYRLCRWSGQRPSNYLNLAPDSLWAFDYDRAVFLFGEWATGKRQRKRTITTDLAPPNAKPTMEVPYYSDEELDAMVGVTAPRRQDSPITPFTDAAIAFLTMTPDGSEGDTRDPFEPLPPIEPPVAPD